MGDAIPRLERAIELDPHSAVMRNDLGYALTLAGRFAESEASLRRVIELDSSFPFAYGTLGHALVGQGKFDAVIALGPKVEDTNLNPLILAYRQSNRPAEAAAIFERARTTTVRHKKGIEFALATIHGSAGNADSAFYWLNRAVDVKDGALIANSVPCDNAFEPFHSDRRFEALLRRVGMTRCQKTATN